MRRHLSFVFFASVLVLASASRAEDKLQLETTIIKNNTELPQIIYIVPWRDLKQEKRKEQTLVLHSLYGDLFDPVSPTGTGASGPQ
ncbi:MAG: hypothetical protein HY080_02650 [Gammaproteobacteria bacterium]|nr:hypothetical protein [Gammaproteobacteria bacterium]